MGILIGNTKLDLDMVNLYPAQKGDIYPVIVKCNTEIKDLIKHDDIKPNGLIYTAGKTAVKVELGHRLILHVVGKSKMATVILLKKQLMLYSDRIFSEVFKYFGKEKLQIRVFAHERSTWISPYVGAMFSKANITSYEVVTVKETTPAVIY